MSLEIFGSINKYVHNSADILAASKLLLCPQFPFISLKGEINPTLQGTLGFGPTHLRDGFMRLCNIGLTAELAEVYQAMKAYIDIVERYQGGSTLEPDLSMICTQRNLVQHHLLSLQPAGKLGVNFRQTYPMYEACRLAGLILGVGVIFPLPAQMAPLETLMRDLKFELQATEVESNCCSRDAMGVLIWILTLGGIAATGFPERLWYVTTLGRIIACSCISRWQDLKQILELMPWLETACDRAGQQLWNEVEALSI